MSHAEINGKSIFYTLTPQTSKFEHTNITTVFIHGLGSSSRFYQWIIPSISERTACLALDTPGSGQSSLGDSQQTVSSIAEDVIALLNNLSIREKIIVVGHSMGGIIASEIAAQYAEKIIGVVLIGPVNPSPSVTEVFDKRIELVEKDGLESLVNSIPFTATGRSADAIVHATIRDLLRLSSVPGYLSLCRVIASAQQPKYDQIKAPLLVLAGEDDKTSPLQACQEIYNAYGTANEEKTLHVLPGIGHWHCVEGPGFVTERIEEFINTRF